jgi:hypothetical protein
MCSGGLFSADGVQHCFSDRFGSIGTPALDAYQPIPPLDISDAMPQRGTGSVSFALVDFGGVFANSDVWLVTDCQVHQKAAICHKPGTPAEKVLTVGLAAISGHLRHGDTLDLSACRR